MSVLGMGPMEILLILLVMFLVLGPERMVDASRLLGKAAREVRRLADELPSLTLDDGESDLTGGPLVHTGRSSKPGVTETEPSKDRSHAESDEPVSFRRSQPPTEQAEADSPERKGPA